MVVGRSVSGGEAVFLVHLANGGGMQSLSALVGGGWTILSASDVNDLGQIAATADLSAPARPWAAGHA